MSFSFNPFTGQLDDTGSGGPHTHPESDVTNLTADLAAKALSSDLTTGLAGKAASVHSHAEGDVTSLTSDLAGKAASVHTHTEANVTGLVSDLAAKAASVHTHAEADVTALVADLAAKAPLVHTHEGGGSANIKQTEIDFGTAPVCEASFVVTDVDVLVSSQILGSVAYEAPTGKDLDELDMDGLDLKFAPGAGQLTIYARGMDDAYIADKFKINYLVG